MKKLPVMLAAAALAFATQAAAQDKLKVGILTTLSGPPAALGVQQRNGFQLALKNLGGKLGGREVELLVQDDELKPDVAVGKAKAYLERDKVDFVVGPVFSNMLQAILKPVTDSGTFLISPNAGTSNFAGKECNANLFVVSYQNDQNHEVLGKYAHARFRQGLAKADLNFDQKTTEFNLNYVIKQFNARVMTFIKDTRYDVLKPNGVQAGVGLQIQM